MNHKRPPDLPDDERHRLGYVEPYDCESISHYLGRLRHFKANSLPSATSLGTIAGIGAVTSRWEKLYFNPFPSDEELEALGNLIQLTPDRLRAMLPPKGMTMQPRPIRLCGVCYGDVPCHRIEWQYKDITAICHIHRLRLLERCPSCKKPFQIPALWTDGKCYRCQRPFTSMAKTQHRVKTDRQKKTLDS